MESTGLNTDSRGTQVNNRTHPNATALVFFKHNFCVKLYVPREPRRDPSNRRLSEHGIYIRHCPESSSQPVPSQAGADTTRPR